MQFAEEIAIVRDIENNQNGEFVVLETQSNDGCGNCHSQSGCASVFSYYSFKPKTSILVRNTLGLKRGDSVIVELAQNKILMATILMYLLPVFLLLLLSLIAKMILGETASIFGGVIGLLCGLLITNKISKIASISVLFKPQLLRKVISIDRV